MPDPGSKVLPRASAVDSSIQAPRRRRASWRIKLIFALAGVVLGAPSAWSQLTLSTAYQGPSAPTNGGSIDPGGIYLVNPGTWTGPYLFWDPLNLGLTVFGIYNSREVDALSWGEDSLLTSAGGFWGDNYRLLFSTDEFSAGDPSILGPYTVLTQGANGNEQASADVQLSHFVMSLPVPSPTAFYDHNSVFDGDGIVPLSGLDLGLIEPNTPGPGPDEGDTLDAIDQWQQSADMKLYFSLDAAYVDPLEGPYGNSGTAQANGVNPSDVLVSNGFGSFSVWAPASLLGLGPTDDLDALILHENGNDVFDPSAQRFDWVAGDTDMLLFSVRRGSPIIGTLDSKWGWPIEEGDILTTPCTIFPCPGGSPAIFIHAESLGLGTVRNGSDAPFLGHGDDLDAMMVR